MDGNVKDLTAEATWKATLNELELQMTQATFNTWLARATFISEEGGIFTIGVRNDYAKDWIENRLTDTITRTMAAIWGRPAQLVVMVDQSEEQSGTAVQRLEEAHSPQKESANGSQPHIPESFARRQPPRNRHRHPTDENRGFGYRQIRKPTDPLKGMVPISHYAIRFWREYLIEKCNTRYGDLKVSGAKAFDLWLIISSYAYEFEVLHMEGPSIKQLVQKLGLGDKHDIVGRAEWVSTDGRRRNAEKYGLLNVLRDESICDHYQEGSGRGAKQFFYRLTKIEHAPLLTPKQAEYLTEDGRKEHQRWLQIHTDVKYDEWLEDARDTAIPELFVEVVG